MIRDRLAPIAAALAVLSLAATAQAQAWRPTARQCAAEINGQHPGCAGCSGLWPQWAECTAKRWHPHGAAPSGSRLRACMAQVTRADANESMAADRVGDVMRCLGE